MILQASRSRMGRRLQRLETVLTDDSRAVPHTRKWLLFWTEQMGKYMCGELKTIPGLIPVEAFRAVTKACDAGDVESPYARIVRGEDSNAETGAGPVRAG